MQLQNESIDPMQLHLPANMLFYQSMHSQCIAAPVLDFCLFPDKTGAMRPQYPARPPEILTKEVLKKSFAKRHKKNRPLFADGFLNFIVLW